MPRPGVPIERLEGSFLRAVKLPEDFAEHSQENLGVGGAEIEAQQHAAELFFGTGGRARVYVAAEVEGLAQGSVKARQGLHIGRGGSELVVAPSLQRTAR